MIFLRSMFVSGCLAIGQTVPIKMLTRCCAGLAEMHCPFHAGALAFGPTTFW